jgi:hypothetical protein
MADTVNTCQLTEAWHRRAYAALRKHSSYAAFEKRTPCPCFTKIKAKLARRAVGGAWDSSKGRIYRIKAPPICAAARVAVCATTD